MIINKHTPIIEEKYRSAYCTMISAILESLEALSIILQRLSVLYYGSVYDDDDGKPFTAFLRLTHE